MQLRQAITVAPKDRLGELSGAIWKAYDAKAVTDDEAQGLAELIAARKTVPAAPDAPRRATGSRPRSDASMERRRRWAASGRLPPGIAARFTVAEQAALAVVTIEITKRGDCRLHLEAIAAMAGVSRSTVRNALRHARKLGLMTVEERRASAWRNLSNVVQIVSREWLLWMRLARADRSPGGGGKSVSRTITQSFDRNPQRASTKEKGAAGGQGRGSVTPGFDCRVGPPRPAQPCILRIPMFASQNERD